MIREYRAGKVAATDPGGFRARVLTYDVVDDYGTTFPRGCANDGLRNWLPVLAYGHDWSRPIGRAVSYEDAADGLYMDFRFDDGEAVPLARQARAQVLAGTLTDVSIGFMRTGPEKSNGDGSTALPSISIDEVSLVLRAAVPGAKVLAARSGRLLTDDDYARAARALNARPRPQARPALPDDAALLVEADEALDLVRTRPWG